MEEFIAFMNSAPAKAFYKCIVLAADKYFFHPTHEERIDIEGVIQVWQRKMFYPEEEFEWRRIETRTAYFQALLLGDMVYLAAPRTLMFQITTRYGEVIAGMSQVLNPNDKIVFVNISERFYIHIGVEADDKVGVSFIYDIHLEEQQVWADDIPILSPDPIQKRDKLNIAVKNLLGDRADLRQKFKFEYTISEIMGWKHV